MDRPVASVHTPVKSVCVEGGGEGRETHQYVDYHLALGVVAVLTITISCLAGPCLKYMSCLYLTLPLTDPASCTHCLFVTPHPHPATSSSCSLCPAPSRCHLLRGSCFLFTLPYFPPSPPLPPAVLLRQQAECRAARHPLRHHIKSCGLGRRPNVCTQHGRTHPAGRGEANVKVKGRCDKV